jgi:hypothetical protein
MANDPIPQSDAEFDTFQANIVTYVNAHLAGLGLGLGDADVTAMNTAQTDWNTKYPAHIAGQATAQSLRQAKDLSRNSFVTVLRRLINRFQASSAVDDSEKAAMRITVRDTIRTPVGAPTTRPVLLPDTSQRLRIVVAFADEGTPTSKAKPEGVSGCEIWVKIGGPPPTDLTECHYLATDTRTPYTADFDGSEANQTAHFIGRWVSTRNEPGPLSETVSATIPG